MANTIITIARQYGSGGREIGEKTAELLGIKQYDRELITMAAQKGNLDEEAVIHADEKATNSLLYTLAMGSNIYGIASTFGYSMPINDRLFALQSNVIRELSNTESCIFIGRCADYVLRENKNAIKLFIYAPIEDRKIRVAERHPDLKEGEILSTINKIDKRRSSYYNYYTGNKWGKYDNYDFAINSSKLGVDGTARLIADIVNIKSGK